jgi:hypothetical protein
MDCQYTLTAASVQHGLASRKTGRDSRFRASINEARREGSSGARRLPGKRGDRASQAGEVRGPEHCPAVEGFVEPQGPASRIGQLSTVVLLPALR